MVASAWVQARWYSATIDSTDSSSLANRSMFGTSSIASSQSGGSATGRPNTSPK